MVSQQLYIFTIKGSNHPNYYQGQNKLHPTCKLWLSKNL